MSREVALPLGALAVKIRAEVEQADRDWHGALDHARKAGALLIEAKAKCAHGEWLPWLDANFDFTRQTAADYMRVANVGNSLHLGDSINGSLKAIARDRRDAERTEPEPVLQGTPEQIESVLDDLPAEQVAAVQIAARNVERKRKGKRRPPKVIGKSIPEPSSPMLDYCVLGALSASVEADAARAIKVIRRGNLDDASRNDDEREMWLEAADACRAVASELKS